jgi:hypothetical protein
VFLRGRRRDRFLLLVFQAIHVQWFLFLHQVCLNVELTQEGVSLVAASRFHRVLLAEASVGGFRNVDSTKNQLRLRKNCVEVCTLPRRWTPSDWRFSRHVTKCQTAIFSSPTLRTGPTPSGSRFSCLDSLGSCVSSL